MSGCAAPSPAGGGAGVGDAMGRRGPPGRGAEADEHPPREPDRETDLCYDGKPEGVEIIEMR